MRPNAHPTAQWFATRAVRRLGAEQKEALGQVNWFAVLPAEQLNDARKVLVRAVGDAK